MDVHLTEGLTASDLDDNDCARQFLHRFFMVPHHDRST